MHAAAVEESGYCWCCLVTSGSGTVMFLHEGLDTRWNFWGMLTLHRCAITVGRSGSSGLEYWQHYENSSSSCSLLILQNTNAKPVLHLELLICNSALLLCLSEGRFASSFGSKMMFLCAGSCACATKCKFWVVASKTPLCVTVIQ